jgi:hypothetical protein
LPEIGTNIAYNATREGVAERFDAPAVQQTIAGDLARLTSAAQRLSDLDLWISKPATHHAATPLD